MFIAALFIVAELEAIQMSIKGWVNKTWYISGIEYYSALERKEIMSHDISWMNHEYIMLGEISHSQKDKYGIIPCTWGI